MSNVIFPLSFAVPEINNQNFIIYIFHRILMQIFAHLNELFMSRLKIAYFILEKRLKGTQILIFHIFRRYTEFLFCIQSSCISSSLNWLCWQLLMLCQYISCISYILQVKLNWKCKKKCRIPTFEHSYFSCGNFLNDCYKVFKLYSSGFHISVTVFTWLQ